MAWDDAPGQGLTGLIERGTGRNLIDIVAPGDPAACYARLITWLLDPRGEHQLGDDLLASLIDRLEDYEVDWPATPLADADTWFGATERVTGGRWEINLWAAGKQLVLVQELLGSADLVALAPYRLRGVPVVALGLSLESFTPRVRDAVPVWTYEEVLGLLEDTSASDAHTHLVVEFREHMRALVNAARQERADSGTADPALEPAPSPTPAAPTADESPGDRAAALAAGDARARAEALARAEARARAAAEAHAEALKLAEARAAAEAAEAREKQEAEEAHAAEAKRAAERSEQESVEKREDMPTQKLPRPTEPPLEPAKPEAPSRKTTAKGKRIFKKELDRLVEESEREAAPKPIGSETTSLTAEMILSDDGNRAYVMGEVLGVGGQGRVFEASITGDQSFPSFARPVERAVLKMAHSDTQEALERERAIYEKPDRGLIKLLDAGKTKRRTYLILERLHSHPFERFAVRVGRVDMATAVDTFVNLLDVLKGLHSAKGRDLVLCDIKPDNIMLRMSSPDEKLGENEYLSKLAKGAYEPVFIDVGCAQSRNALRESKGRLPELIGTPLYLPPESIPRLDGDEFVPGIYSTKTDVYSLTLSFYEHLTGERPYAHRGLFQLRGEDHLREVFAFKNDKVNPINVQKLRKMFGGALAEEFQQILYAGLHPDPERRASLTGLQQMVHKTFRVQERLKKDVGNYYYDVVRGLRLWQQRFPRIKPEQNIYNDPRG